VAIDGATLYRLPAPEKRRWGRRLAWLGGCSDNAEHLPLLVHVRLPDAPPARGEPPSECELYRSGVVTGSETAGVPVPLRPGGARR
jgi:hypothetical protein